MRVRNFFYLMKIMKTNNRQVFGFDRNNNVIYIGDFVYLRIHWKSSCGILNDWIRGRIVNVHGFPTFKCKDAWGKFVIHRMSTIRFEMEDLELCEKHAQRYIENQVSYIANLDKMTKCD